MKKIILFISISCCLIACNNQKQVESYNYQISLTQIDNGTIHIDLFYNGTLSDSMLFCFPKIVSGIYNALNYGKFVNNFQAFDKKYKSLTTNKINQNCWRIINAQKLNYISYDVTSGWKKLDLIIMKQLGKLQTLKPYQKVKKNLENNG